MCNTNEKEELSANNLWLVSNSKKCPNNHCNAPIQKNEGCNHIKCYKCKFDFCWICLEPWKKHSSATGGYFQCNRYEASTKLLQKEKVTVAQAEEQHVKAVELNKFVHYYTRFKNHELSFKIEEPLLAMAKTKFEILTNAQQTVQSDPNRKHSLTKHDGDTNLPQTSRKSSLASRQFAKKLSQSLEKGVSKIFNNQDWHLLNQAPNFDNCTETTPVLNKQNCVETKLDDLDEIRNLSENTLAKDLNEDDKLEVAFSSNDEKN